MKIIKIILALFAGLALLVGGVVAYVAATFDPNTYKAQVIQLVKDKKQRTLHLDGDIKLKFWPNIGADLGKVALSEFKSDAPFAAVDNLRVALKVMPLVAGWKFLNEAGERLITWGAPTLPCGIAGATTAVTGAVSPTEKFSKVTSTFGSMSAALSLLTYTPA